MLNKPLYYFLCLYIFLYPLIPSHFELIGLTLSGDRLVYTFTIIFLIFLLASKNSRQQFFSGLLNLRKSPTLVFLTLIILIMFISTLYAVNRGDALKESIRFGSYFVLYLIIKFQLAEEKFCKGILKSYLLSCFVISLIGLVQFISFAWPYTQQHMTIPIYKIESILENSNNVGAFFILAVFPLILLTIKTKDFKQKTIFSIIASLALINIILSFSRNAWIALATGCILLIVIYNWKLVFIFVAAAGIAFKVPQVYSRVLQVTDTSQNLSRIKIWGTALEVIRYNFWLGVGNANFTDVYNQYSKKFDYISYEFTPGLHPHNIFLKIQSELGVFGSITFIGFLISAFIMIRKFIHSTKSIFLKSFYQGYLISFIVFLQMNLMDNFFSAPKVRVYFFLLLAIIDGLLNRDIPEHNL